MNLIKVNADGLFEGCVFAQPGTESFYEGYVEGEPPPHPRCRLVNGVWVEDAPSMHKKLVIDITTKRNQLLLSSDWTQLPDVALTEAKKAEWATYRQALRDLTAQQGFPTDVIWPTPPG